MLHLQFRFKQQTHSNLNLDSTAGTHKQKGFRERRFDLRSLVTGICITVKRADTSSGTKLTLNSNTTNISSSCTTTSVLRIALDPIFRNVAVLNLLTSV